MAHTLETITTLTNLLKEIYAPIIEVQTPEKALFLKKLQTVVPTVLHGGKQFNIFVEYDAKGGVGTLAESDTLPISTPSNNDVATVSFNYHYFRVAVTGPVMAVTANNTMAAAEAMTNLIKVRQRAFAQHLNRQCCGDGLAILAQMDGDDDGAGNLTVDNAGGWSGQNNSACNGHKFFSVNQYINGRTAGTACTSGLLVTAVTPGAFPSTSAILAVTGTSTDYDDGDYLYAAASATASNDDYGHEMIGVKGLVDDNTVAVTLQGISATTYSEWNSAMGYGATEGTAEALTTIRMMNLHDDVTENGGQTDFIAASPAVWVTYGNISDQNNQIMNATTYDVAWPTLNFNGIQLFKDSYLADNMYFIDTSTIKIYQPMGPGWIDKGGGSIGQITDKDEFEATWRWYATLGITNRAKNGKMVDITVLANKF